MLDFASRIVVKALFIKNLIKSENLFIIKSLENKNHSIYYYIALYFASINKPERMLAFLSRAINYNNIDAMYVAADYYKSINDVTLMISHYTTAASLGHVSAMYVLGYYYDKTGDHSNSINFYEMACAKNHKSSLFNLAQYYHKNNNTLAVKYYMGGIKLGESYFAYHLALYYEDNGNISKMVNYLKLAINMDKSNHDAIKKLAQYYYNIGDYEGLTSISVLDDGIVYLYLGRHNIDIGDKNIAVYYYLKAISKNMTEAMYELGNIYKTGEPFVKYHTLAAKELYIPSMKILAEYYRKIGQINLMIDYYTILSSFGDIDSMNKLSYYYSSIGDYDKMILYLDLVSEQQRQIPHQVAFDSFDKFNYCTYGTDEFSDLDMPKLSKTSILGLETDTTDYGLIGETYDLNEFSEFASHIDHAEITI